LSVVPAIRYLVKFVLLLSLYTHQSDIVR
jgi:hypothetical protein